MVLTLLVAFLAVLGYILDYFIDKQKHRNLYKWIAVLGGILSLVVIGVNHLRQEQQIKDWGKSLYKITKQNDSLLSQNDSLEVRMKDVSEKLQPFVQIATRSYPALNEEEALTKLVTDISRTLEQMQPKLTLLTEKTELRKDNNSLFHTIYFFDSQYPVSLRNISIEMKFDGTVLRAEYKINGAFVIEQGSKMLIENDKRGFIFVTGLLTVGNEIVIEVISKKQLNLISKRLSP
ncbi:MAG: hypothetical protein MUP17_10755 [candidate division Zixibacteria bacterium]|nr:hypothetical protein [candidate division Zixibacteria bacterium]